MLKVKDRYKLELQIPETMKLFDSTKKLIDKTKNGENVPSFECLVDNQYQNVWSIIHFYF